MASTPNKRKEEIKRLSEISKLIGTAGRLDCLSKELNSKITAKPDLQNDVVDVRIGFIYLKKDGSVLDTIPSCTQDMWRNEYETMSILHEKVTSWMLQATEIAIKKANQATSWQY